MTYNTYPALKSLIFTLVCVGAFFGGVGEAKAITFDFTVYGINDWWNSGEEVDKNDNGTIDANYDWIVANFTANTDKAEYVPDEQIIVAATAFSQLCQNLAPYFNISASIEYGGSTNIITDEYAGYQVGALYGEGALTAPNAPGTYDINIHACHYNHEDYNLNGCVDEVITITVAGDPVLDPDAKPDIAASMQSPANGSVFKAGSGVYFTMAAINAGVIAITDAGEARLEVDIDGDGARSSEPWTDTYDQHSVIPNDTPTLGSFALGEVKPYTHTMSGLPVGDHEFRFEVDATDIISEENGYNNLSSWQTMHVIEGDLTVPSSVVSGEPAVLTWDVENIDGLTCVVQGGGESWPVTADGSATTKPLSTMTSYSLSCGSVLLDGPLQVAVTGSLGTPDLSASNLLVEQGNPTNLNWNTNNGNEKLCELTGGTLTTNPLTDDNGDVNTGSEQVTVFARTTYTLTCPTGSDTVTVEVLPKGYET